MRITEGISFQANKYFKLQNDLLEKEYFEVKLSLAQQQKLLKEVTAQCQAANAELQYVRSKIVQAAKVGSSEEYFAELSRAFKAKNLKNLTVQRKRKDLLVAVTTGQQRMKNVEERQ